MSPNQVVRLRSLLLPIGNRPHGEHVGDDRPIGTALQPAMMGEGACRFTACEQAGRDGLAAVDIAIGEDIAPGRRRGPRQRTAGHDRYRRATGPGRRLRVEGRSPSPMSAAASWGRPPVHSSPATSYERHRHRVEQLGERPLRGGHPLGLGGLGKPLLARPGSIEALFIRCPLPRRIWNVRLWRGPA